MDRNCFRAWGGGCTVLNDQHFARLLKSQNSLILPLPALHPSLLSLPTVLPPLTLSVSLPQLIPPKYKGAASDTFYEHTSLFNIRLTFAFVVLHFSCFLFALYVFALVIRLSVQPFRFYLHLSTAVVILRGFFPSVSHAFLFVSVFFFFSSGFRRWIYFSVSSNFCSLVGRLACIPVFFVCHPLCLLVWPSISPCGRLSVCLPFCLCLREAGQERNKYH